MSFRDMVLQRDFAETHASHETEPSGLSGFFKSQSPMMLGWLAIMGLNLLFMLVTFQ